MIYISADSVRKICENGTLHCKLSALPALPERQKEQNFAFTGQKAEQQGKSVNNSAGPVTDRVNCDKFFLILMA